MALIERDREDAAKRGEVPNLDGDPFVGSEEWEVQALHIDVRSSGPARAMVTVTFKNLGAPRTVILDLIVVNSEWRIANIRYDEGDSLRGIVSSR